MSAVNASNRSMLPSVDRMLRLPALEELAVRYGRPLLTEMTRDVLTTALEEPADKVDADLQRFMEFDRKRLYEVYEQCSDLDKRELRAASIASELEQLFDHDASKMNVDE